MSKPLSSKISEPKAISLEPIEPPLLLLKVQEKHLMVIVMETAIKMIANDAYEATLGIYFIDHHRICLKFFY